MFNVHDFRAQFPSIVAPNAPIFLDNPAGTQVPQSVIQAITNYFLYSNANSGGTFATSKATDALVSLTREKLALFLNASSPSEIVIGANSTTLNFALSRALAKIMQAGDEILLTRMDHDANVSPWLRIAEDHGFIVRFADIRTADCTLDLADLEANLTERTRIVATVHASNAVGTINPVAQIADMAHAAGALYIVDAVQSAPHIPLDVQALGCDFLLCSAYKFFGPHQGVLWGRYDLLESLPAYKVRPSKDKAPYRWETGTSAYELIAGVGAAVDYIASLSGQSGTTRENIVLGMERAGAHERALCEQLIRVLQAKPEITIYGITETARFTERVPTVVFTHNQYSATHIAEHFAAHNIYLWDGDYYAVEIMARLGHSEDGMVRVGIAHYNTHEEIEQFAAVLNKLS